MQFGPYPAKPNYSQLQFTTISRSMKTGGLLIKVYPNPAFNILNVDLTDIDKVCTFRLLSTEGKILKTIELFDSNNSIDLSGINNGLYFYEIIQGKKTISSNKIIILE